jgi:hypothetical protein
VANMVRKAISAHDMHMRWSQRIWKHEMMSPFVARPSDAPHFPPHAGYLVHHQNVPRLPSEIGHSSKGISSEFSILVRVNQFLCE